MKCDEKLLQRLPTTVKPIHYELNIVPNVDYFTFKGDVSITIQILETTDEITLHAVDLTIETIKLIGLHDYYPKQLTSSQDGTMRLHFEYPILFGVYTLIISYRGLINSELRGIYRSKYINDYGEEKYTIATQFAPTDARRCFPCWDEPSFKSTFNISVTVSKNLVVLSNMPCKITEKETDNLVRYHFEKTPLMSTYLVALVIGAYDFIESGEVKVYTPIGKKHQGLFVLNMAVNALSYYKNYFKINYTLPKIDLVSITESNFEAMENWGLIIFRYTSLLVDPRMTSESNKMRIALIIGHELAHQWFGNLVTMKWWSELWLNEGFATFIQYLWFDDQFPHFNIWTQFVNNVRKRALHLDALQSSHAIESPVTKLSQIPETYDDINYKKGASIIRMLHSYIGDEQFKNGMQMYFKNNQFKNTCTEDLWKAFEDNNGQSIKAMMNAWTYQQGYPLVYASKKFVNNVLILTLRQQGFAQDIAKILWIIPISIIYQTKNLETQIFKLLLDKKEINIELPNADPDRWIKINHESVGFYRTQYSADMLENLAPAIRKRKISASDRLGILDDLFALVKSGNMRTTDFFYMLKVFEDETNFIVLNYILNMFDVISQVLEYLESRPLFNIRKFLSNMVDRLGKNKTIGERNRNTLLHDLILNRLAEIPNETEEIYLNHTLSNSLIYSEKYDHDKLLQLFQETSNPEQKYGIIRVLGNSKDPNILEKILHFSISGNISPQDCIHLILSTSSTKLGRELAWNLLKLHFHDISLRLTSFLFSKLVKHLTENFATEDMAIEVEQFFQTHKYLDVESSVQQSVEIIKLNSAWLKRDGKIIKEYLQYY